MKVLTLNTHSWMEADPLEKLNQLAKTIIEEDYQLIALQEVNQLLSTPRVVTDSWFQEVVQQQPIHQDNFAYLLVTELAVLGQTYYWSWVPSHLGYDKFYEGSALLSKEPIIASQILVSTATAFEDYRTRRILVGQTSLLGHPVVAYSCHYSWWDEGSQVGFKGEWQRTLAQVALESLPQLFLGDFNNPADVPAQGYDYLLQSTKRLADSYGLAETRLGEYTVLKEIDGWEGNQSGLRIDLALVSPEFTVKKYQIIFDGQNRPVVSDHYGLAVTLEWQKA